MREQVYFIQSEDGFIKIGKATDVDRRILSLQTSNPKKLSLLGVVIGKRGIEKSIHRRFKSLRINGEWFKSSSEILGFIESNKEEKKKFYIKKKSSPETLEFLVEQRKKIFLRSSHSMIKAMRIAYRNSDEELKIELRRSVSNLFKIHWMEAESILESEKLDLGNLVKLTNLLYDGIL